MTNLSRKWPIWVKNRHLWAEIRWFWPKVCVSFKKAMFLVEKHSKLRHFYWSKIIFLGRTVFVNTEKFWWNAIVSDWNFSRTFLEFLRLRRFLGFCWIWTKSLLLRFALSNSKSSNISFKWVERNKRPSRNQHFRAYFSINFRIFDSLLSYLVWRYD